MDYLSVYTRMCESRRINKQHYCKGSNLHKHHIIPSHAGGLDTEENFTYLSIREHILAHFMLWKIYRNPNDLRSMHMLGAKLTSSQRHHTGIFCRDNKIGFFAASPEDCRKWRIRGIDAQKKSGSKNSFYYWSTPEGRRKRASLGGLVGSLSQMKAGIGIHDLSKRREYASLGGKSMKGRLCVTNGTHRTRIKPELLQEYISKGYREGFTLSS